MVKRKVRKVIELLQEVFERKGFFVEKIVVFGSQIKGTTHDNSDIDIVVISKDFEGKDIFERAEITGRANREVMRKILVPLDIISMTPKEWEKGNSLITEFAGEGEILYA